MTTRSGRWSALQRIIGRHWRLRRLLIIFADDDIVRKVCPSKRRKGKESSWKFVAVAFARENAEIENSRRGDERRLCDESVIGATILYRILDGALGDDLSKELVSWGTDVHGRGDRLTFRSYVPASIGPYIALPESSAEATA